MLACQQRLIDEMLVAHFGYHLLQLSVHSTFSLYDDCRVQNKYRCHPFSLQADAQCDFDQLPFDSESMDVVVLHHAHEFVPNPHAVLRELQRVVIPNGLLVVIGFNPWSLLGLYSNIGRFYSRSIWQNHLIAAGRMKDWLSLLGFETEQCQYGHHFPELLDRTRQPLARQFSRHWPLGNFYIMSAIKHQAGVTPLKPRWQQGASGFAGLTPIKPRVSGRCHSGQHTTQTIKEDIA